jgi:hypothetical protein
MDRHDPESAHDQRQQNDDGWNEGLIHLPHGILLLILEILVWILRE